MLHFMPTVSKQSQQNWLHFDRFLSSILELRRPALSGADLAGILDVDAGSCKILKEPPFHPDPLPLLRSGVVDRTSNLLG